MGSWTYSWSLWINRSVPSTLSAVISIAKMCVERRKKGCKFLARKKERVGEEKGCVESEKRKQT
jgi:hypothetical protein